jgi:uncharacterized phiE125 gp8 family phage protein
MGTLELVTGPAADIVTDAALYDQLRVDLSGSPAVPDDAAYIQTLRAAVTSYLDGAHGILGRALITQTWRLHLDRFPCWTWSRNSDPRVKDKAVIRIPLPPLQTVSSITYVDTNGATQTLAPSVYQVVNKRNQVSEIVEAYGQTWPTTRDQPQAVTVEFIAGYGDAGTDVEPAIQHAIKLAVSEWYENRESVVVGQAVNRLPMAFDALIAPYRVNRFG